MKKDKGIKSCCSDPENMEQREYPTRECCMVCGANHYRLIVESGTVGAKIKPLG